MKQKEQSPESEPILFGPSAIHGIGGFANHDILAGTLLIQYVGEKIDKRESLRRCEQNNRCVLALDEQFDLDGNVPWNPARFLNHSCNPNCEAELREGRIWIVARRDIRQGEEITFNYGFDLEDYKNYPCACGSANCVGYIVDEGFFDYVRKNTNDR
jgi:SET domain-containing protein